MNTRHSTTRTARGNLARVAAGYLTTAELATECGSAIVKVPLPTSGSHTGAVISVAGAVAAERARYSTGPNQQSARNAARHLDIIESALGHLDVHQVTPLHLQTVRNLVQSNAARRKSSGGTGVSAAERFTIVARGVFNAYPACLGSAGNPADGMARLMRGENARRNLTPDEVHTLLCAVDDLPDPVLMIYMIAFALQTGCRSIGLVNLTIGRLVEPTPYVILREKGARERKVPITDSLRQELLQLALSRGARTGDDAVFRSKRGVPLTTEAVRRRMRDLRRAATARDWMMPPVTFHWFRHTAINQVVHVAGPVVAALFAGHANTKAYGTTVGYMHPGTRQLILVARFLHGTITQSGSHWARASINAATQPIANARALPPGRS